MPRTQVTLGLPWAVQAKPKHLVIGNVTGAILYMSAWTHTAGGAGVNVHVLRLNTGVQYQCLLVRSY